MAVSWRYNCAVMLAVAVGVGGASASTFLQKAAPRRVSSPALLLSIRGGDAETTSTESSVSAAADNEPSLDDKVYAAMKKFGIPTPGSSDDNPSGGNNNDNCQDGVCIMPGSTTTTSSAATATSATDPHELSEKLAKEFNVDDRLTMAAIGATSSLGDKNQRVYNEEAARTLIQQELDLINRVGDDHPNVKQLVSEGYDVFMSRRALAFADENMEDARAILLAEKMDEEEAAQAEEEEAALAALRAEQEAQKEEPKMDTVEVKANFDPTKLGSPPTPNAAAKQQSPGGMPKPAKKEAVVFEATTAQIQELVLESPVPVLLDIYADWCGPCKALSPVLEEMAVKGGGVFRLVKVNSDNERPVSGALEVTALPTIFGVRDGKIVHMFQGMPKSEEMMKNFMMGLFGAAPFSPPVTAEESAKYEELTQKLIKTAGAASFSFSARERLTDRISTMLDKLVDDEHIEDVESSAMLLRTLLNNVVKNPYEQKYRKVNLANSLISSKIGGSTSALAILKSVGFSRSANEMYLHKGKKVINVAPIVVAKDTIEKWVQKNKAEMAAAARKRKDEMDRVKVQEELAARAAEEEEEEIEEEDEVDPTACNLKLRLDGKKKVHEVTMHEDDPLSSVLTHLKVENKEEVQITCVAKRLVIKASDEEAMNKSLKDHGLMPAASIVVKVGSNKREQTSSLKDRSKKRRKKGSHTMQSVGIYSKDDNNKAELIDGGGGVWYEHDVTSDDEAEKEEEEVKADDETAEENDEAESSDENEE